MREHIKDKIQEGGEQTNC